MIPSFRDVGISLNIDGSEDRIDRIERKMIVTLLRFNDNSKISVLAKSALAKFFVQDFSSDLVNVFEKSVLAKSLLAKDSL